MISNYGLCYWSQSRSPLTSNVMPSALSNLPVWILVIEVYSSKIYQTLSSTFKINNKLKQVWLLHGDRTWIEEDKWTLEINTDLLKRSCLSQGQNDNHMIKQSPVCKNTQKECSLQRNSGSSVYCFHPRHLGIIHNKMWTKRVFPQNCLNTHIHSSNCQILQGNWMCLKLFTLTCFTR